MSIETRYTCDLCDTTITHGTGKGLRITRPQLDAASSYHTAEWQPLANANLHICRKCITALEKLARFTEPVPEAV